jgi:hypothetical protein
MNELRRARLEAAGSGLIHAVPPLRGLAARYITGLTGEHDLLLRWRVGKSAIPNDSSSWHRQPGHQGAKPNDLTTWSNDVFATRRTELGDLTPPDVRPAFAYRRVGSAVIMVGTRELPPTDQFLQPVDFLGRPAEDGAYVGVVGRTGPTEWEVAIGIADREGTRFIPVPTVLLDSVVEVPPGLNRV